MATTQPRIDVELRVDPATCDLSRATRFSFVVLLTLRSNRPVTIVKTSFAEFDFGLVNLLQSGIVECVDADTGDGIPIFGRGTIEPTQNTDPRKSLPDMMTLSENRTDYITFTSDSKPRKYEFELETAQLQPSSKYVIQCQPFELGWWSHDSIESCLDHLEKHGELPHTGPPPLRGTPGNSVSFSCRENTPSPPSVSVSLLVPSSTLSLAGNPPFKFSTVFTSHASQAITALAERPQIIQLNEDIEILDAASRNRVAPDRIAVHQHGPFRREDYIVLEPEKPHSEERSISIRRGLEDLKANHDYILHFRSTSWRWWSYDSLDDVMLLGKTHGSVGHFRKEFCINLDCHEEVRLHVVE